MQGGFPKIHQDICTILHVQFVFWPSSCSRLLGRRLSSIRSRRTFRLHVVENSLPRPTKRIVIKFPLQIGDFTPLNTFCFGWKIFQDLCVRTDNDSGADRQVQGLSLPGPSYDAKQRLMRTAMSLGHDERVMAILTSHHLLCSGDAFLGEKRDFGIAFDFEYGANGLQILDKQIRKNKV